MYKKLFLIILLLVSHSALIFPQETDELQQIRDIFALPENKIDIAYAKLTIDKIIDPSIDINLYIKKMDKLVASIKTNFSTATRDVNLKEINKYLYEKGSWNNYEVYSYDIDDPLGKKEHAALLSTYLDTKKGNCVSMPVLYFILANRFNLNIYLSHAPTHIFIQYKDSTGKLLNIESTNMIYSVIDSKYYIKHFLISQSAIQNKIYLQPLTNKEAVAVLIARLLPFYYDKKEYKKALYICDLSLKYYPKNVSEIANKGAIYGMLYNDIKFKNSVPLTDAKREYLDWLKTQNIKYTKIAENLGWINESEEEQQRYLDEMRSLRKS